MFPCKMHLFKVEISYRSMKKQYLNIDYLNLAKEPMYIYLSTLVKRKKDISSRRVLIVNPSAIGDFVVSLPAICTFLKKHNVATDLLVSPPVKPLAERVRGISNVYVAASVHGRSIEQHTEEQHLPEYDAIYVIKLSKPAYRLLKTVSFKHIHTSLASYLNYALHLTGKSFLRAKTKQWREINFEIFKENSRDVPFEKLFAFTSQDYRRIRAFPELKRRGKERIVLIHTGSGWKMKMWENKNWIETIKTINKFGKFKFVFVGGKEEAEDLETIRRKLPFKISSLIGKANLRDLLLAMRMSDYFIGIDSGPRNMAHIADLRSVSIFGPGPHMFMPLSNKDIVLDKSKGGRVYERFFYKKNTAIKKITPDEVVIAFKRLLKNS